MKVSVFVEGCIKYVCDQQKAFLFLFVLSSFVFIIQFSHLSSVSFSLVSVSTFLV